MGQLNYKNRFWYCDTLFLHVLAKDNGKGHDVFESLFKNKNPKLICKFLVEETSFWGDLAFVLGSSKEPFVRVLLEHVFWITEFQILDETQ